MRCVRNDRKSDQEKDRCCEDESVAGKDLFFSIGDNESHGETDDDESETRIGEVEEQRIRWRTSFPAKDEDYREYDLVL